MKDNRPDMPTAPQRPAAAPQWLAQPKYSAPKQNGAPNFKRPVLKSREDRRF